MSGRVLIACVGNVLRHDDGFGVAVARELERRDLPDGVELIETGIGGMTVVQQLMDGYAALVVVDAMEAGAEPGTLWTIDPDVPEPSGIDRDEWRVLFQNLHLAEPHRIFLLARSLGALPPVVRLVGCQPADTDSMDEILSPRVAAAVPRAVERVLQLVRAFALPVGA
ncbi:MAG TPA: hydrogenase maturation protease [Candidatus Limnocylindrales bacterium]|nr:hydrogenase maturation protease [Candidatus Limnocylindrales bacterium]